VSAYLPCGCQFCVQVSNHSSWYLKLENRKKQFNFKFIL
jgi:hypothetical protein